MFGALLYLYQVQRTEMARARSGLPASAGCAKSRALAPDVERAILLLPTYGKVFPAEGERRYRVAFLGGCIANFAFARLNEATVRVLQKNGCEVSIPRDQTCCGALHVHSGLPEEARSLARRNIDALLDGNFDAIITNAGGCGSTLKEYGELLEHDPDYSEKARRFSALVKDVNEFLASIDLNIAISTSAWPPSRWLPPIRIPATWRTDKKSARRRANCSTSSPAWSFARCRCPISAAAAPVSITSCIPTWR